MHDWRASFAPSRTSGSVTDSGQRKVQKPLPAAAFYALAAVLAFVAYAGVLWLVGGRSVSAVLHASLLNVLAMGIVSAIFIPLLRRHVLGLSRWPMLAAHVILAILFAFLNYWLLMVLLGLAGGNGLTTFQVSPFIDPAFAWQMLQGVTVYTLVAALTHLRAQTEPVQLVLSANGESELPSDNSNALSRYFIREGDDIHPVDVSRIVIITGAGDYSEVATLTGRHLVRMTLASFEEALDPRRFIRVHRSRIVNVERIERIEPAGGGRMLLHMENGERIQTSRSGTRLLRERVI